MTKEEKLIWLYLYICEAHDTGLCVHCQRMSNNCSPEFSDSELMTCYLFGIIEGKCLEIKAIHRFIRDYWGTWFPALPCYAKFAARLNRLSTVFPALSEQVLGDIHGSGVNWGTSLVDSMPIMLACGKRSTSARVAAEICDKSYCASKDVWYYGVKLHLLAFRSPQTLPLPEFAGITPASEHDLTAFERIAPRLFGREVFADKAYFDSDTKQRLENQQFTTMHTSIRRVRGQQNLPCDHKIFSTLVSKARQPLESLFNWIIEKTGIQKAAKVRSFDGLQVHVFGKFAAACLLIVFKFLNS